MKMVLKTNEDLIKMAFDYVRMAEEDAKENPTSDDIQIVVVEPMKKPYKKTIPNTLESMQEIVAGYIEILPFGKTETGGSLAITYNGEGEKMNLPFNRKVNGSNFSEIVVGTFFITAYNMQGDNISLNDLQCEKMIKRFLGLEVYL
jgi:hypothetical protein